MTKKPRSRKRPPTILSADEIRALLQACNRGPTGARNRALLVLCWRAGLRSAEALALRPADLDARAGLVHVRRGKGGRPRTVGLDPEAFAVVEAWLARRDALGISRSAPLLCTLRGDALDAGYCRAMLARVAERAGLRRRAHLHALRHTHAVQALREGVLLPEVQAQLGHASLSSTAVYLQHVAPEDLAAAARRRPSWAVTASCGEPQDS